MLFEVRIKVTSPLLGEKTSYGGMRRFSRAKNDTVLQLETARWTWLCSNAIDTLHLHEVDPATIFSPPVILLPTLHYYRREIPRHDRPAIIEQHECIRTGSELTFNIVITSTIPGEGRKGARPPTKTEMQTILEFIGTYIGISPFGVQKGFGRFTLLSLKEK